MGACPTLTTERLVMRPFTENDLDAFTEMMCSPEVRALLHLPYDYGRAQAWQQMAMWLGQWELRGTGNWLVEERATGALVGRVGTHRPERDDWPGVEIGWTLHPAQWGKGFATEAGAEAVGYAFAHLGVDELFSCILPDNLRSQAVAQRLGFTLFEQRVLSAFPSMPHGIWRLTRST